MKLLIASDIHGSAYYCKMLTERFEAEKADKLVLLGDILYHGPRNDLPRDYAPKEVIALLSPLKDRIFCVRGNCDSEVDQMVLPFPIMADYGVILLPNCAVYATHGHKFCKENLPPLQKGDVLLCGHTHIPEFSKTEDYIYVNCGSVSIPKENSPHSYVIYENGELLWKDLNNGTVYKQEKL